MDVNHMNNKLTPFDFGSVHPVAGQMAEIEPTVSSDAVGFFVR